MTIVMQIKFRHHLDDTLLVLTCSFDNSFCKETQFRSHVIILCFFPAPFQFNYYLILIHVRLVYFSLYIFF